MSERVPLVYDGGGNIQQLQAVDDLNIPLNERVDLLEVRLQKLIDWLRIEEIDVPFDL